MVSKIETINLSDLRIFQEVAQRLNLTASGDALGLPKSAVSKAISRLEANLGVKLLERSSRRVALTHAGQLVTARAESLLAEADSLTSRLQEERQAPGGRVRLTAPPELGGLLVERLLPSFTAQFPQIRLAIRLGYHFDDILDPGIDLGLRVGQIHDDRLVATAIGQFRRIAVASPAYLATHPVATPDDLRHCQCLMFGDDGHSAEWTLECGAERANVMVAGQIAIRSFTALLQAAKVGLGVARVPDFAARAELQRGELLRVLPQWASPASTVYRVHRFGHDRIARVAAVIAALQSDWMG